VIIARLLEVRCADVNWQAEVVGGSELVCGLDGLERAGLRDDVRFLHEAQRGDEGASEIGSCGRVLGDFDSVCDVQGWLFLECGEVIAAVASDVEVVSLEVVEGCASSGWEGW